MVDLQLILTETLKQDSLRHHVWNIDKLYTRRNMCIKTEKKQHMWDQGEKNIHHHICVCVYIYVNEYNVCKKWSQGHGTCNEKRIHQNLTTSLKNTLPLSSISPMLAFPLTLRLISSTKTTPPFCHEWQRVYHWDVIISLSYSKPKPEPEASSSSSPPSEEEDSSTCSNEGEGTKSPSWDWRRAMQPILMFI